MQTKIYYFDYFISKIITRSFNYQETDLDLFIKERINKCGLNKLKLLKLLFFVSVIKVEDQYLMDDIFNNFYAMPYGPVESDVYKGLDQLPNYEIYNDRISLKVNANLHYIDQENDSMYQRIDNCIDAVYTVNSKLFSMSAFELVELSHKADSWRIIFSEARKRGIYSSPMPKDIIKETTVYFK